MEEIRCSCGDKWVERNGLPYQPCPCFGLEGHEHTYHSDRFGDLPVHPGATRAS